MQKEQLMSTATETLKLTSKIKGLPHWVQNRLIINLWQQCIEGDREFKTKGGDGDTSVTRIIT